MYYFYRKSNRGHEICLLYRGCPPFGESVIRGILLLCNSGKCAKGSGDFLSVLYRLSCD